VSSGIAWDDLYRVQRHLLKHPSEHVVRFLDRLPSQEWTRSVDIGCGAGRHTALLRQYGCSVDACDVSELAIRHTRGLFLGDEFCRPVVAPMTELPYKDGAFRIAVAYGVFYYGTWAEMQQAVDEMHRVLKRGGKAFVCVRTTDDWRARRGEKVDTLTYRLEIPREPEDGMTMTFLPESRIEPVYAAFSELEWEKSEVTINRSVHHSRARKNSDWLITVTK
jgi:SAM-dependent methyltransferase